MGFRTDGIHKELGKKAIKLTENTLCTEVGGGFGWIVGDLYIGQIR